MIRTEWFDALSVHMAINHSRRGVFHASGGLAAALTLATVGESAGRKKKKKKGKRSKPKPTQPCSQGLCASQWNGKPSEIDHCEFICRQCDGDDPREFCIVDYPSSGSPDKAAVCCGRGETCCGSECADLGLSKFHCGRCNNRCPNGLDCLNGECISLCGSRGVPCPEHPDFCCGPPYTCCPGFGCVNTNVHGAHCGACGHRCARGQDCFDGQCVSTDPPGWEWCDTVNGEYGLFTSGPLADNRWHCGGCNTECPGNYLKGQWCFEGICGCGDGRHWCGEELSCWPDAYTC